MQVCLTGWEVVWRRQNLKWNNENIGLQLLDHLLMGDWDMQSSRIEGIGSSRQTKPLNLLSNRIKRVKRQNTGEEGETRTHTCTHGFVPKEWGRGGKVNQWWLLPLGDWQWKLSRLSSRHCCVFASLSDNIQYSHRCNTQKLKKNNKILQFLCLLILELTSQAWRLQVKYQMKQLWDDDDDDDDDEPAVRRRQAFSAI